MRLAPALILACASFFIALVFLLYRLFVATSSVLLVLLLLLLLAFFFFSRDFIQRRKRLRDLAAVAERIAAPNSPLASEPAKQDEIARTLAALERIAPRLERTSAEIEQTEKMRRDFVANVSHELRTPLASVLGYSETLLESASDDASREFLQIIRKNAVRMSRLADDLLTLARVESGEQHFAVAPVPVSGMLEDAVTAFNSMAASKGIRLELEQTVPWAVHADAEAVHRVFANLIQNAINYSGAGRIVVGARERSDFIEFYVRDFGAGIPAEHLPRLFERFYRVDAARSREVGGTGLGLAIAKHIVLAHGGEIRAESISGQGATFLFTLPIAGGMPA